MGNTVAPRMRREAGSGRRPSKNVVVARTEAVAPGRVAVTARELRRRDGDEEEEEEEEEDAMPTLTARAGPGRRRGGGGALRAGAGDTAAAATVATVKVVMSRKDAEALVARLNAQRARERKARMAALKGELRRAGGGGASPATCGEAWRPRLVPIQES